MADFFFDTNKIKVVLNNWNSKEGKSKIKPCQQ